MVETLHPVALAYAQGIEAGRMRATPPSECPWPSDEHEACVAWFAGYSMAALATAKPTPIMIAAPQAVTS